MIKKIIYSIFIVMVIGISITQNNYKVQAEGSIVNEALEDFVEGVNPYLEEKKEEQRKKEEEEKQQRVTTIFPDLYKPDNLYEAQEGERLAKLGNIIIGVIRIIGTILSVIVLTILGIKYMIGSSSERAEYKKSMTPYIIGAVMVFAITNILGIIINVMESFSKNSW